MRKRIQYKRFTKTLISFSLLITATSSVTAEEIKQTPLKSYRKNTISVGGSYVHPALFGGAWSEMNYWRETETDPDKSPAFGGRIAYERRLNRYWSLGIGIDVTAYFSDEVRSMASSFNDENIHAHCADIMSFPLSIKIHIPLGQSLFELYGAYAISPGIMFPDRDVLRYNKERNVREYPTSFVLAPAELGFGAVASVTESIGIYLETGIVHRILFTPDQTGTLWFLAPYVQLGASFQL